MTRARIRLVGEERAQATVELAAITPVLIVLALIVYNLMLFTTAVARFDRVVTSVVHAHATPHQGSDGTEGGSAALVSAVTEELEQAMAGHAVTIEVELDEGEDEEGAMLSLVGALQTYRCVMRYEPWPSRFSLAGIDLGAPAALTHERSVTIDPWRSGVVV